MSELEAARERYRQHPTEANAQACERLYLQQHPERAIKPREGSGPDSDLLSLESHVDSRFRSLFRAQLETLASLAALIDRVDELERLAGRHGTIVLPPDGNLLEMLDAEGKAKR